MSIRVSKKHGINPCIPLCFWCGKEKNEVALLGTLKGDVEATKSAVLNYEPCDTCKAQMAEGIALIEVTESAIDRPPIQDKLYPTGAWWVISEDTAKEWFNADVKVLEHKKAFINTEIGDIIREIENKKEAN